MYCLQSHASPRSDLTNCVITAWALLPHLQQPVSQINASAKAFPESGQSKYPSLVIKRLCTGIDANRTVDTATINKELSRFAPAHSPDVMTDQKILGISHFKKRRNSLKYKLKLHHGWQGSRFEKSDCPRSIKIGQGSHCVFHDVNQEKEQRIGESFVSDPVFAYLFSSENMSCQFDLGEVAFTDGFQQPVVTDVWLVIWCGCGDGVPTSRHAGAARWWLGVLKWVEAHKEP